MKLLHMYFLTLHHTIPTYNNLRKNPSENIVGKGENICQITG